MGKRRLESRVKDGEWWVAEAMGELGRDGGCRAEMIRLMDHAAGIWSGGGVAKGLTLSAEKGLRGLPLYLVRRVEYESTMRRWNRSEMEIARMHGAVTGGEEEGWYYGDVREREVAVEYLMRGVVSGNVFARRVLEWLAPERGRGLERGGGRGEWLRAIECGDRQRAVELGRMVGGGEGVRPDATMLVRMGGREQKALSANNIGHLLAHGNGVARNVEEAIHYYDMAIAWGSAAACSNKGWLLQYGQDEGAGAFRGDEVKRLYEMAIERGERNYAPRNLGVLLGWGGCGLKRNVVAGARWLLVGLREGDQPARDKCARSLQRLVRSWRMAVKNPNLKNECLTALKWERQRHAAAEAEADLHAHAVMAAHTLPYGT